MLKKILIIFSICLLLQGCFGAFVAGAAAGGVVAYEGRNFSQKQADHKLTVEIQKRIENNPELKNKCRIIVEAYDGVVLVTGQVPNQSAHDLTIKIAEATPGAKRVYDELAIGKPISAMTQSSDAWITTKVKTDLIAAKGLNSSQIKVITENSVVYLMGITTPKQAKIASEVTRKVSGVKKVVTLFEFQQ